MQIYSRCLDYCDNDKNANGLDDVMQTSAAMPRGPELTSTGCGNAEFARRDSFIILLCALHVILLQFIPFQTIHFWMTIVCFHTRNHKRKVALKSYRLVCFTEVCVINGNIHVWFYTMGTTLCPNELCKFDYGTIGCTNYFTSTKTLKNTYCRMNRFGGAGTV